MKNSGMLNFTATVWLYPGETGNWHFVTIPKVSGTAIKKQYAPVARGWGSLPVSVTIGKTTWDTSIFPDGKSGTYLLPLKALVRRKEGIAEDDRIRIQLTIRP